MRRFTYVAAAAILLTTHACLAQTGPGGNLKEVTVTGSGVSRDEAVRDAMRKAVEKGAGTFISSRSEVKDFALIRDTVLVRAAGFIQSHKELSANKLPDGTWQVKLRAVVSIQGIEDTWGAVTTLLQQMGRPKIMVCITEKIAGQAQADSTLQARIENILLANGFLLVDKQQLKEVDRRDIASAVLEDKPQKLQAIAKRFGAQLFLTGTADATPGPTRTVSGVQLFPYQATANVRCFRTDTAQLLSSVPGGPVRVTDRVGRSAGTRALDALAIQLAPLVRRDMLTFWQDALTGRGEVQLHVENLSFAQYAAMKKKLAALEDVKQVKAEYHNKIAECSVQSRINAETLAEKLLEVLPELEITDVSQNVIKATFKE